MLLQLSDSMAQALRSWHGQRSWLSLRAQASSQQVLHTIGSSSIPPSTAASKQCHSQSGNQAQGASKADHRQPATALQKSKAGHQTQASNSLSIGTLSTRPDAPKHPNLQNGGHDQQGLIVRLNIFH